MKVSIDEVKYIAKLAKLSFSDEEAEKFAGEFESILDQFQYLSDMDLEIDGELEKEKLEPIVRKDEVKEFDCKDLLSHQRILQEKKIVLKEKNN